MPVRLRDLLTEKGRRQFKVAQLDAEVKELEREAAALEKLDSLNAKKLKLAVKIKEMQEKK